MTSVDPFLIPIPRSFLNDPEIRQYMEYKDRVIHDLYLRTGGADDAVETVVNRDVYDGTSWAGPVGELNKKLEAQARNTVYGEAVIPQKGLRPVTVNGGTYEAVSGDFVNAKNRALIKFPASGSLVVRNGDGSTISLDGNGRLINGKSTGKLYNVTTTIEFYYFVDDDAWYAK